MNFLQLVQRLRQECGVSGAAPVTAQNQSGEILRLVNWINSAWMDIQSRHSDWFFLRTAVQFNSVAQQQSYTPTQASIPKLSIYKQDSFRLYLASRGFADEMILPFKPYDDFRNLYMFGANRTNAMRPVFFTVDPQKNFLLGPLPDDVYVVNGEGYTKPQELAADTDTPSCPDQYHMAIVYRAMMHYGEYESAPEVYQHGELEFGRLMHRLEIDQIPTLQFGAPLA